MGNDRIFFCQQSQKSILEDKRIALFTGAYNHIADGVSLTLNRLVGYLESQDVDIRVFAPTSAKPVIRHEGQLIPVPSIAAPGRPDYRVSLGLPSHVREHVEAFEPGLVHIATPDLLGRKALLFAKKRGLPIVATYHTHFSSYLSYYRLSWAEPLLWRYLRWFYGHCNHIYVPSESMADVLRENGIQNNLYIWERGVETDRFNPAHRSEAWRKELGIGPEEVVISFVSRLVLEKGLDIFAEVVEALHRLGIPHRSVIVGEGPARESLQKRLPDTLFLGHQSGNALATAYASSDVFLFPSETETFGNVTLEAMASGLPAVCADATGSRSLVIDGETGFLAPPRETAAFVDAVRKLVLNPSLRQQMREAAFREAQRYAWPVILEKLNRYYDLALHEHEMEKQARLNQPVGAG